MDAQTPLRDARHGVLLWWRPQGDEPPRLRVQPSPVWFDGAGVWLAAETPAPELRARPVCTLLAENGGDDPRIAAQGRVRPYGLHDPLGLALHGLAIAGALSALALRGDAATGLRVAGGAARSSVLRLTVDDVQVLPPLAEADGIAPALPAAVPGDVRRAIGGRRQVAVVRPWSPGVTAAVWDAGMTLHGVPGPAPWVAVVLAAGAAGLALEGPLDDDARLRPERVRWWHDGEQGEAAVTSPVGAIVLPD